MATSIGCKTNQTSNAVSEMPDSPSLHVALADVEIAEENAAFEYEWEERVVKPGVTDLVLRIKAEQPTVPTKTNIKFTFPSVDINQYWNPGNKMDKANYYYNSITSRSTSCAPLLCFLNDRNQNRMTVACSEALNKVTVSSELIEEDSRFHIDIEFFNERLPKMTSYELTIRLDTRATHFNTSIADISQWWAEMPNYKPTPVPEEAKKPMYSTWYSFHQDLDVPKLMSELKVARNLGMTAVIVDDGWQTLDNKRGYAYTGDWNPDRIPDLKGFVQDVHDLDMKCLLWYSVPFVGENADNYETYKGKYLRYWESQGTYVLDPRYPEVREFIITTYEKALTDWNLDGFKLDFMGWFAANKDTELTATDGRDIASVNAAVDVLMTDVMTRLRAINPEIMVEFRQPYIGPLMRKYGNMFRASDCPNMAIINRVRVTDIRLLSGDVAVHSDMFMWHKDEPVESAALQILNIIFSVPQLSVMLDNLTEEQLAMTTYYLDYWNTNKEVLLDGKFCANSPASLYPILRSKKDKKEVIAVYEPIVVSIDAGIDQVDVINAKGSTDIVLDLQATTGTFQVKVVDCLGNPISTSRVKSGQIQLIKVPASGMIQMKK